MELAKHEATKKELLDKIAELKAERKETSEVSIQEAKKAFNKIAK
jgi:hypothetical protein